MCVIHPLKVVIENYPDDKEEEFSANNHPKDPEQGKRSIPFSKTIYIEHDDFMEEPPKEFFRLGPGKEVRLRNAYDIKCTDVIKNDAGEIVELRCEYDPDSAGKNKKETKRNYSLGFLLNMLLMSKHASMTSYLMYPIRQQ